MLFIMLTISFTVAILLASGIALYVMMQPKVMKWYMKMVAKSMKGMEDFIEEEMAKDL